MILWYTDERISTTNVGVVLIAVSERLVAMFVFARTVQLETSPMSQPLFGKKEAVYETVAVPQPFIAEGQKDLIFVFSTYQQAVTALKQELKGISKKLDTLTNSYDETNEFEIEKYDHLIELVDNGTLFIVPITDEAIETLEKYCNIEVAQDSVYYSFDVAVNYYMNSTDPAIIECPGFKQFLESKAYKVAQTVTL